jgi:MFS family permease
MSITAIGRRLGTGYWYLWWANTVSSVGDGAIVSALPLLAVTITRDPRLIALVSAAAYWPWLLLSLPAGVLVDRYDRVRLMRRAQLVQALAVGLIAVLVAVHDVDIAVLVAVGFCLGAAEVVASNSAQSVLPRFVPAEQLPKANGNLQVSLTVGETFLGPPLGSLLFAAARVLPFGLDAVSFAGSAALLAGLPKGASQKAGLTSTGSAGPPGGGAAGGREAKGMLAQIGQGLRWLFRHRLLRIVALLLGVSNFASQMGQATLVLLATATLHVGTGGYGLLWTAAAVGSILGGLVNPAVTRRVGQLPSLAIAMGAAAAIFVGIGLAPDAVVLGMLMACNGFFSTMWNVVTVSLRQRIIPADLLGRVNSVYRMIGWGLMPIGAIAGGFVARYGGLRASYVAGGILCAVTLLAVLPALLHAGRRSTAAPSA